MISKPYAYIIALLQLHPRLAARVPRFVPSSSSSRNVPNAHYFPEAAPPEPTDRPPPRHHGVQSGRVQRLRLIVHQSPVTTVSRLTITVIGRCYCRLRLRRELHSRYDDDAGVAFAHPSHGAGAEWPH